jgi:hypothetical protein
VVSPSLLGTLARDDDDDCLEGVVVLVVAEEVEVELDAELEEGSPGRFLRIKKGP